MLSPNPFLDPRPAREPILNLPGVVTALLLLLGAGHLLRALALDPGADALLVTELAVIPARWLAALEPARAAEILGEISARRGSPGEVAGHLAYARFVLDGEGPRPWSVATYALLHGSLAHLALNGVWLAAFGSPVARRLGAPRFLLLAALATVAGAAAHVAAGPASLAPMIGASAAVSGMMAAAARFALGGTDDGGPVHLRPAQSLRGMMANRQAAVFVGVWFATNALVGVLAEPLGIAESGIAWQAHMGGFLAGLAAFPVLDPSGRRERSRMP